MSQLDKLLSIGCRWGGADVSENIYSNPSGFTDVPWEISIQFFMGVAIGVIQAREDELNESHSDTSMAGEFRNCPYCGVRLNASATRCVSCMYELKPVVITSSDQEEKVLLSDSDYEFLNCDPGLLESLDQEDLIRIHNLLVDSLRMGCQMLASSDANAMKVREGLIVSKEWDAHYRNLWPEQPKYLIWMAARHAVLGNPLAGEVFEWNNQGSPVAKVSTGGKVAGAAALGILAGFLFS
jgi:hypothetical protein